MLDFTENEERKYYFGDFILKGKDKGNKEYKRFENILYVDVGSKDVELYLKEFNVSFASLLVLGEGSLTIFAEDEAKLEPYFFSGIDEVISASTQNYQLKNNLTLVGKEDIDLTLKHKQRSIFNASLLGTEKINGAIEYSELSDYRLNLMSLGNEEGKIEIESQSSNFSSPLPIFVYMPNGDMEIKNTKLGGFVLIKELEVEGGNKQSSLLLNPEVVNNLSKKAKEIIGLVNTPGGAGNNNGPIDGPSNGQTSTTIIFEATRERD